MKPLLLGSSEPSKNCACGLMDIIYIPLDVAPSKLAYKRLSEPNTWGFSDVTMNIGISYEYTYLSYECDKASNIISFTHTLQHTLPLPLTDLSSDRSRLPRVT